MKKFKRRLALALAFTMVFAMLAGCKSGNSGGSSGTQAVKFPLATPVTLTVWQYAQPGLLAKYPDQSDLPKYKEIQKRTNITIKLITPPIGQEKDQLNLVISSGQLPDIFDNGAIANYYPGGTAKAFSDGVIAKLNDLQKKYAPDLTKIYNTYKDVDALCKDDNGNYLYVPMIRGSSIMAAYSGLVVRQDWLTKLNLSAPVTMDDWENMLTQFKTKLGATAPLDWSMNSSYDNTTLTSTSFIGTYGINYTYFNENGKILFGPADPRYKDFLIEMAKWYKEGLIDPEIATNTQKTFDAKMCSNKSGAAAITFGGMMGKYIPQMASVDPNYKLVGVNYPVLKTGDFNRFYQTSNVIMQNGFISATSKNKEVAMAFLNYGFTPEGYILYNFGIEGQSFDWVNSYPKYTPLITKNPDGLSMQQAIMAYAWSSNNGDMVQDPRFTDQYMPFKEQSDALKTWTAAASKVTPMNSYLTQGRLTVDESSSITSSETQISTYRDEMVLKFMEGVQPINDSTWNTYIAQLKSLGLDNDLKVRQAAEDRFKKNNPSFYTAKGFSNPFDSYKNITK